MEDRNGELHDIKEDIREIKSCLKELAEDVRSRGGLNARCAVLEEKVKRNETFNRNIVYVIIAVIIETLILWGDKIF